MAAFCFLFLSAVEFSESVLLLMSSLTLGCLLQTCLRESDNSNEEDSLSTHSEDRLSEGSWDRVERKDAEVSTLHCLVKFFAFTSSPSFFLHSCKVRCIS